MRPAGRRTEQTRAGRAGESSFPSSEVDVAGSAAAAKWVSGRSARVQDSIDKLDRLGNFLLPAHAYLLLRRDVYGRFCAVAELPQLARAEHQPPDRRLPALEDEVVGAEERDLDLGLLDAEQIPDRLGQRPVAVLERRLQLA